MAEEQTRLKQLLGRLRQEHNSAWLHGVLEHQQEPVMIIDPGWQIWFANTTARQLFECKEENLEGTRLRVIAPRPDRELGESICYPAVTETPLEFRFSENEWAGELAFLVRIRAVLTPDQAPAVNGLSDYFANSWQCWVDRERKVQFVSPNVLQLTGYSSAEFQAAPELLVNLIHPDDRPLFRRHQDEQFESTAQASIEVRLVTRTGESRWIHHICQPAYDEENRWIGRYESYQDITEYKTLSAETQRVQSILETVAVAGQHLLTTGWRALIPDLLGRLGEAAEVDRVSLLANVQREGSVVLRRQHGWQSADLAPELTAPPFKTGPLETSGLAGWEEYLTRNQPIQAHVRKMPARQRAILTARNIKSTLAVPIFTGPEWWGFLQFDSVRDERVWSSREVDALEAFASMLSSTIQRERTEDDIRSLVETERRRAEMAWALREVSLALNAVLDAEVVLDRLLTLLGQVVVFDIGTIYLLDNNRLVAVRQLERNSSSGLNRNPVEKSRPLNSLPLFERMAESLAPLLVSHTSDSAHWISLEGKASIRSWMGAPIIVDNKVMGFFSVGRRESGSFRQEHLTHLAAFANQSARAFQNARLFDEVAETLVNEQRLNEISQIISSSLDLAMVLQTILRLTSQLVAADMSSLALVTEEKDLLHIAHTFNTPDVKLQTNLKRGQGISWRVVETGAPVVVNDYANDPQAAPEWVALGVHGYLGVPLIAGTECLGALSLFRTLPKRGFKERERFLAEMVARQAGVAIQNARRYEEAQRLATRDSLTGLYNRRHFFELAVREFERSRRYGRPVSAILLDLDNLKQINDTFGHPSGDRALQKVAQLSLSTLRRPDLIGRYGGDEFVMLLPETSLASALTVAERLRSSVSSVELVEDENIITMTVSIGVAALSPEARTLETLIDHADQAQYQAKSTGKNQVRAWEFKKKPAAK